MSNPVSAKCVLIVEDEPMIRFDAVDMVEDAGFEVCSAENASTLR